MNNILKILNVGSAALMLLFGLATVPAIAAPTWQIYTLDSAGDVGQHTSIALDRNGIPVISYLDNQNGFLKLVRCGDAVCSSGNSIQVVDGAGGVGGYSSLKLDRSGNPVISYFDYTNGDLKLVRCADANCASGRSIQTVDSAGVVGEYTSLALDSNDNPVISYYDNTNSDLKVVHCGNADCSGGNSIQTVDSEGFVGLNTSLVLDANGNPVIAYSASVGSQRLKLARCGNPQCSSGNSIQTVDSTGSVGLYLSLALDLAGNPVIAYFDGTNVDLKVAHCGNASCSGSNSLQTVDSAGLTGAYPSVAVAPNGNPLVGYMAGSRTFLKFVRCGDPNCSAANAFQNVDVSPSVGSNTSMALDATGNPVISYYDNANHDLKVARLGEDVTAPKVTLNQAAAQADPTSISPITFTAVFNEPVTGFNSTGVIVGGSTGAGAVSVTELAPRNGTTFNVAVSGMTTGGALIVSIASNAARDAGGNGNTSSTSADNTVTFVPDTVPPVCSVTVSPASLWPPNHKLVDITTAVSVSDNVPGPRNVSAVLLSVTSSEADSGLDAEDVPTDIQAWFGTTGQLRAERFATVGRTYTITYLATDKAGNQSTCSATVKVPLN